MFFSWKVMAIDGTGWRESFRLFYCGNECIMTAIVTLFFCRFILSTAEGTYKEVMAV